MGAIHRGITNPRSLVRAIQKTKTAGAAPVIVDIKPISPRDGDLLKERTPGQLARMVQEAGACAVSVVTESVHFGGSLATLREVSAGCDLPVLQKDFFTKLEQVDESRDAGASAFLIILSTVSDEIAHTLHERGRELGMEAVVEVHTEQELKRAIGLSPAIIGINNRDISRLELDSGDVGKTELLAPLVPEHIPIISESSLLTSGDVKRAYRAGADAVLIGTAILKAVDLRASLKSLTSF